MTKFEVEDLIKMNKFPSKWPWLNENGHIEWIGLSKIDHLDLTFSEIDRFDFTLSQMSHIHLMV